eukprot:c6697_g1_i2 orf=237-392(-)
MASSENLLFEGQPLYHANSTWSQMEAPCSQVMIVTVARGRSKINCGLAKTF